MSPELPDSPPDLRPGFRIFSVVNFFPVLFFAVNSLMAVYLVYTLMENSSGRESDAALNVTEKIHVFWIVTHIFTVFLAAQRQLSDGLLDLFWQGIYISFILFLNLFFFYGALGLFVPLPFLPADTALTVKTALTGVFYMALYLTNLTYLPYLLWRRFFRH